jgi:hypothetical protein
MFRNWLFGSKAAENLNALFAALWQAFSNRGALVLVNDDDGNDGNLQSETRLPVA